MSPTRVQDDQVTALWRAGQGAEGRSGPQARGAHVPGTSWSPWPADTLSQRAGWGRCPWRNPRVILHPCLTSMQTFVHKYTFSVLLLEAMTSQSEMRVQMHPPPPNCFVTTNCWPSGPERSLLKVPYQSSARGLEPHLGHAGTVPSRWGPGSCSELWVQGYCTNASALASLTLWKHVVLLTQLSDSLRSNNVPNVYKYE